MKVKKILTFAFAAVLMTSMTSCGNEDGPGGDGGGNGGGTVVVSGTPEQVADCPQIDELVNGKQVIPQDDKTMAIPPKKTWSISRGRDCV